MVRRDILMVGRVGPGLTERVGPHDTSGARRGLVRGARWAQPY